MAELLQRLNELEKSVPISNVQPQIPILHSTAEMPANTVASSKTGHLVCAVIIVLLAAVGLYYMRPAFLVTRDKKKRKVLNVNLYATIIALVIVVVAGAVYLLQNK